MATTITPFATSHYSSSSPLTCSSKNYYNKSSYTCSLLTKNTKNSSFRDITLNASKPRSSLLSLVKSSVKDEQVVAEEPKTKTEKQEEKESNEKEEEEEKMRQQEMDWKTDDEFKKFMGDSSIEAAIKLEKKRADRKLRELDRETSDNPIVGFFYGLVRDSLTREKERLEKAEETFKALDLNKVC